jgi:site-specific recombinase XerD
MSLPGARPHNPDMVMSFDGLTPKEDIMFIRRADGAIIGYCIEAGVAEPFLADFWADLRRQGYAEQTADTYRGDAAHLGDWCARRSLSISEIDERVVARFTAHLRACKCARGMIHRGYRKTPSRVRSFLEYLRERGVVPRPPEPRRMSIVAERYCAWMRTRGLAEATIEHHAQMLATIVERLGEDTEHYRARDVREFVIRCGQRRGIATARAAARVLRGFLRYLAIHGRCSPDLIGAVPALPGWSQTSLPRYLPKEAVERIVVSCSGRPARRDRAILLLLARLGLRAGDVLRLRLDDLDWDRGRLRVVGKERREFWLPLPQDAGDAVLAYIEKSRPPVASDRVFIRSHAPYEPITRGALRPIICKAMRLARVKASSQGAHVLRHSLATRLLREGATLDLIGTVLRHRNVSSTALYAKVDVETLRRVAQPWPAAEVAPC